MGRKEARFDFIRVIAVRTVLATSPCSCAPPYPIDHRPGRRRSRRLSLRPLCQIRLYEMKGLDASVLIGAGVVLVTAAALAGSAASAA